MTAIIRPVILSGGAGTRLWPLSTEKHPKQFLPLLGEPLFEATLRRVRGLEHLGPITVVTGDGHLGSIDQALENVSAAESATIIIEPAGRNTAPAVLAAALVADRDDVLVVLPSDHVIADVDGFRAAVRHAIALASEGALVIFGVQPTRPETGYGYIEKGEPIDGGYRVARFKEKPEHDEAEQLVAARTHLWNCGMFVFSAGALLEEARRHSPDLVAGVGAALPAGRGDRIRLGPAFADVAAISLDHAVIEKTGRAIVIPVDVGWSDIGSWQSLWELSGHDASGNALVGEVRAVGVTNSYVLSSSRTIAIAGVDGMVVVETPDAVMVLPMSASQKVRELVNPPPAAGPAD
ncbi:MAG: mannose-1-phosphate guanylyltransferase [Acidimicrobiia bacterium]